MFGCGDSSSPSENKAIGIVAGANVTDTISAIQTQGLVVQLRRPDGSPDVGVEVRFEAPAQSRMLVSGVGQASFDTLATATTDAAGRATVRVQMGTRAGAGWVAVLVPLIALRDTARYTIVPGNATRVALSPRDTAVLPGVSFTYRGSTVDRAGNARPDPATFTTTGSSVRVTTAGRVTVQGFGISRIHVRATVGTNTATDSGVITVLPPAQIAWSDPGLILGDLHGASSYTLVPNALASSWEPGSQRLVFARPGLFIVDLAGNVTPLPTPGVSGANWPEWSVDRQWIYFHGVTQSGTRVMRIHPDGTGIEPASDAGSSLNPSPSPDGRSVAYTSSGRLIVFDLVTRTARVIGSGASFPRWAPNGEWIAFLQNASRVAVVRPNGNDMRQVSDRQINTGYSWSPDSKWILGHQAIIDVETGVDATLAWIGPYPAWSR
jgi:hypothetical protein